MKHFLTLVASLLIGLSAADLVTYAGGSGDERFHCVHRLADGTLLLGGEAPDDAWMGGAAVSTLAISGVTSATSARFGCVLHLSADGEHVLHALRFPAGTLLDIRQIRSTEVPGAAAGAVYLSGTIEPSGFIDDGKSPGYALVRLNGNFVSSVPNAAQWALSVNAGGEIREVQPWDVDGAGRVTYASGKPFVSDWAAIYRCNSDGIGEVVRYWPAHWNSSNEWDGWDATTAPVTIQPISYSGIVLKAGRSGSLRSATAGDHGLLQSDERGHPGRQGRYPDDYYFSAAGAGGPGYTGYRAVGSTTQRCVAIAVDRRDGDTYVGYSTKSVLPDGNPDFEPAVAAFTVDGTLKWWARLYQETNANSTPDQYVDGLAIDYSSATPQVAVLARSHGNNTVNFWAHPDGQGFQNGFTGTAGNIHISWLGRLRDDGDHAILTAATWHAEWAEGASAFAAPLADAHYDGWPAKTGGNANLNTTRSTVNSLRVDAAGRVYVLAKGRRVLTTANAYQRMAHPLRRGTVTSSPEATTFSAANLIGVNFPQVTAATVQIDGTSVAVTAFDGATGTVTVVPGLSAPLSGKAFTLTEGQSAWSSFVRVYSADLTGVVYSSLLSGAWDRSNGSGGDNTQLAGVVPMADGLFVVGWRSVAGNAVPLSNVPAWGTSISAGDSALFARLSFSVSGAAPGAGGGAGSGAGSGSGGGSSSTPTRQSGGSSGGCGAGSALSGVFAILCAVQLITRWRM